jgi:hypothetical protein
MCFDVLIIIRFVDSYLSLQCETGVKVKVKVKLCLCLIKHQCHEDIWESGGIAQHIHNLGTGWRRMVSFTLWPLHPQGKSPGTHLIWGCVGPSQCRCSDEEKSPCPCQKLNPGHPTHSLITILTELPQLIILRKIIVVLPVHKTINWKPLLYWIISWNFLMSMINCIWVTDLLD